MQNVHCTSTEPLFAGNMTALLIIYRLTTYIHLSVCYRCQEIRVPAPLESPRSPCPPLAASRWLLSLRLRGRLRPVLLAPEAKVASMRAPQATSERTSKQNKGASGHHVPFYYHTSSPERSLLQPTDALQREVLRFHSNKVTILIEVSWHFCIRSAEVDKAKVNMLWSVMHK